MKYVALIAALVAALVAPAYADTLPAQFFGPNLTTTYGAAIAITNQNTCSLSITAVGTGWTVVPRGSIDGGQTWQTVTTIGGGSITAPGQYIGAISGFATSNFNFAVTTSSNTQSLSVVESCTPQLSAISTTVTATGSSSAAIGSTTFAPSQQTLTATASQIVAARNGGSGVGRVSFTVVNNSGSTIYIGNSSAVTTGTGLALAAGYSATIQTTSAIYGLTSTGTAGISYYELY